MTAGSPDGEEDEREWRFSVQDFEDEGADAPERAESVAGSMATGDPLEPQPISLENAAFVLLGVALMMWLAVSVYVTFF